MTDAMYRRLDTGIALVVRVQPGASVEGIAGLQPMPDDDVALRIRVRAQPEQGKANRAVTAVLAKAFGVPRSAVTVTRGGGGRTKTVEIAGDPTMLESAVEALVNRFRQEGQRHEG